MLAIGFILTMVFALTGNNNNFYLDLFKGLFFYAGLAIGPFLMIVSLKYYNKLFLILGIVSTLFGILSISTRGAIVYSLLFIFFLVWFILHDRKAKIIAISIFLCLIIVYFVFGGLLIGKININEEGSITVETGVGNDKKGDRSTIDEIEWRFGASTRLGTAFINLYNRKQDAGINPIKNSLLGILPRSINPEKPQPSTLDGNDIYSQGMYIIYREIYGYDTFSMSEFPTGAHFYWEFGFFGVIILSLLSGLYITLCAHFFSKLGLIAIPLIVSVFKPWGYVDPKIWVSDIVTQIYQIILPLILLYLIANFICIIKNIFINNLNIPVKRSFLIEKGNL
jgi:hypothetical protein